MKAVSADRERAAWRPCRAIDTRDADWRSGPGKTRADRRRRVRTALGRRRAEERLAAPLPAPFSLRRSKSRQGLGKHWPRPTFLQATVSFVVSAGIDVKVIIKHFDQSKQAYCVSALQLVLLIDTICHSLTFLQIPVKLDRPKRWIKHTSFNTPPQPQNIALRIKEKQRLTFHTGPSVEHSPIDIAPTCLSSAGRLGALWRSQWRNGQEKRKTVCSRPDWSPKPCEWDGITDLENRKTKPSITGWSALGLVLKMPWAKMYESFRWESVRPARSETGHICTVLNVCRVLFSMALHKQLDEAFSTEFHSTLG